MNHLIKMYILYFYIIILLISGCATKPYDYTAFKKSKPRSILVMPPKNNSIEVNAPYIYLSTITRPLAEKGYYVFPVSVIDHFLKNNGLPTPDEMNSIPLDKIDKYIGADAVLYITIEDWGQKFQILASVAKVHVNFRLVDVKSAEVLWESSVIAEESSGDSRNSFAGAIIGAIATQILATTVADHTPSLAKRANNMAINNQERGMLDGPYKQPQLSY